MLREYLIKVYGMSSPIEPTQSVGILVPLLGIAAFTIPLFSLKIRRKEFYDYYTLLFSLIAFTLTLYNTWLVWSRGKPILYAYGGWIPPLGISYEVDMFSAILGLLSALVMLLITIYSIWYTRGMDGYEWYYTLLLGLETGLLGCIYTGDVFNLFVMIEVLAISAYGLVAFYRSRIQAVEAAIKYAFIGAAATTLYFLAVVFIYASFGSLNIADIAIKSREVYRAFTNIFSDGVFGNIFVASATSIALALWAFTFKAAVFPNHFWLPDAHPEAPTPVSAALSGLVVNIGAYATIRFLYTLFGVDSILTTFGYRDFVMWVLLILGIVSGVIGALLMIIQDDVKRLLAYSTISHMGLIFMGIAIGFSNIPEYIVNIGLTATLYHIINHSIGKALLFLAVGILIWASGTRSLSRMAGIGKLYPLVTVSIVVGFLQLMGFPICGGFFSKLLLYEAYVAAGMIIPALMVVVISAISVVAYIKVIYTIWIRPPIVAYERKSGIALALAIVLFMALMCIMLGLAAPIVIQWLTDSVVSSLSKEGVENYINAFLEFYREALKHLS